MSEKDKKIALTIAEAVTKMSDFDKGYLLGMGEAMVSKKEEEGKEQEMEKEAG